MKMAPEPIKKVEALYNKLHEMLNANPESAGNCAACGRCCDFKTYDHLLYITDAELIYLAHHIGRENILTMKNGVCPYRKENKCTVHEYRFAGCRIFCCNGNYEFQSNVTESILAELKKLCDEMNMDYHYRQLSTALNNYNSSIG